MNHFFKLVWSRSLGMLIPVPEVARAVGHGGRRLSARARRRLAKRALQSAGLGALAGLAPVTAYALPQGGSVAAGTASISTNAKTVTVTQTSSKTIINWNSFGIGAGESVNFRQPGASSVALNRVLGNNPSQIFGQLTANGQIFLVNPNGVYFAPGAQVDVGGLVASTLNITDQNFLSGNYQFSGLSTAAVVNYAKIKTFSGGYVAFIGTNVDNEGNIITPGGTTALGAGGSVVLTLAGGSLASFQVTTAALNAAVKNGGAIVAPNGVVLLTAQAKNALLQTVVNNTGIIQAGSVTSTGGVVTLLGGSNGSVAVSGTISANSKSGPGGNIVVSGANVAVSGTARISATGSTGGGTIAIGGGVHGGGNIPQAVTTSVASGAVVDASATGSGAGGTVSVWSDVTNPDSVTTVSGSILARGAGAGAGGFVETSGHLLNINNATVQTVGGTGTPGTWLLDPYNVTIASNGASGTTYANTYTPTGASTILNTAIETALNAGNNVDITTGGAPGSSNGDITVNAAIAWSTSAGLTLNAYGNIVINAAITESDTSGSPLLQLLYGQATPNGMNASLSYNAPVGLTSNAALITQEGSASSNAKIYAIVDTQQALENINNSPSTLSGNYALGARIVTTGAFTPIGDGTNAFTGTFEGLKNTINSLSISGSVNQGFFGVTSNATISDLGLTGLNVNGTTNVGGLVGRAHNTTITQSYVQGAVIGKMRVGGLVGNASNGGTYSLDYATGNITASNSSAIRAIGGLVGSNSATITNSYTTVAIYAETTNVQMYQTPYVGGLVGHQSSGAITDVYSGGQVFANGMEQGLIGQYQTYQAAGGGTNGYAVVPVSFGNGTETVAMLSAALPTGFSSSIWSNAGNKSLPYLKADEGYATVSGTVQLSSGVLSNIITNQTQLQDITTTGRGSVYALGNNITTVGNFTPIGPTSATAFLGTLNGLGYAISDVTIDAPSSNDIGVFDYSSGTIENVGLVNAHITAQNVVGGLVGYALGGTINTDYVSGSSVSGNSNIGGLVGALGNAVTVTGSYATSTDTVTGSTNIGGLVGEAGVSTVSTHANTITGSHSSNTVAGTTAVGGLVGLSSNATITGSYATGGVTGAVNGTTDVGGLVGINTDNGKITAVSGTITATGNVNGTSNVGGLVGLNEGGGKIIGVSGTSTADGHVAGITQVGGLVGLNSGGTITAGSAVGNVTGSTNVGGLVGSNSSGATITSGSYATGNVSGTKFIGGLVGLDSDATISGSSYYKTGTVSGSTNVGGLAGGLASGATVTASYSTNATVTGSTNVGGLIGRAGGMGSNNSVLGSYASNAVIGSGNGEIGGLVGLSSNGTISGSHATGNVSGTGNSTRNIGGLIGKTDIGSVSASYATGNVTGAFGSNFGGLIGSNSSSTTISFDYATGNVSGSGSQYGGLVGHSFEGTISASYAKGAVSGGNNVGGLVGQASNNSSTNTSITESYATGAVTGNQDVGGLVGSNHVGEISYTYATGNVQGSGYVGGLVGKNSNSGVISGSYAIGNVTGGGDVGGLVGGNINTSEVINGYAAGSVPGSGATIGGLVGSNDSGSQVITSDWDTTTSGQITGTGGTNGGAGTAQTTVQLIADAILPGTNASAIWEAGYPFPVLKVLPYIIINGSASGAYGDPQPAVTVNSILNQSGVNESSLLNTANLTWTSGGGSNAGTYVLGGAGVTAPAPYQVTYVGSITITPRQLTITGLSGTDITYNNSTSDPLTGTAVVQNLYNGQTVTLVNDTTGTLGSSNAGSQAVTTSISLGSGANGFIASNYTLVQPTLANVTVLRAPVTVTGLSGTAKSYDGSQSDTLNGTPLLSGTVNGQTLTLGNYATGTLASANAGSETVTTSITLGDGTGLAANYVLTQPTLAAVTVSPAQLTITGPLAGTGKTYDGTTSDALTGTPVITGLVGGQTVNLVGALAGPNAGSEAVTVSLGSGSNGFIASNYVIASAPSLPAVTISPATLTISGLAGTEKVYDGTTVDTLSGTPVIGGLVGGQTVTLGNYGTGTLAAAGPGSEGVTTSITLGSGSNGFFAGNYVLVQPTLAAVTVLPAGSVLPSPTTNSGSSSSGSGTSSGSSSASGSNPAAMSSGSGGSGITVSLGTPLTSSFGYLAQIAPFYDASGSFASATGSNEAAAIEGNDWGINGLTSVSGTTSLSSVSTAPVGARTLNFSGCGPNAASASCAPYKVIDGGVKKPGDPVHLSRTQKPLSARQEAEATTRSFD